MSVIKTEELKQGDILRNQKDGSIWNVDQVLTNGGVLVVQRKAVYDLSEWEEVNAYQELSGAQPKS